MNKEREMEEKDISALAQTDIQFHWICPFCAKNLTDAVELLGRDAYDFHILLHSKLLLHSKREGERLRAGIESLRDGGFGCKDEAQAILDGEHSFLEKD